MENRVTKLFNIKYPIIQGGMVWCSGWRLASAVSNNGGLGLLGAGSMHPEMLVEHIRKMKEENLDIYECLDFMQLWYRDVLMFKVTKDMNLLIFKDEYKMINETGEKVDYAGLEAILAAIDTARTRLNANVNMELAMELLLLTMKNPS